MQKYFILSQDNQSAKIQNLLTCLIREKKLTGKTATMQNMNVIGYDHMQNLDLRLSNFYNYFYYPQETFKNLLRYPLVIDMRLQRKMQCMDYDVTLAKPMRKSGPWSRTIEI